MWSSFTVSEVHIVIEVCGSLHSMLLVKENLDLIYKKNYSPVSRQLDISLSFHMQTKIFFGHQPSLRLQYQPQKLLFTTSVFKVNSHWSNTTFLRHSPCAPCSANHYRDRLLEFLSYPLHKSAHNTWNLPSQSVNNIPRV